MNILTPVVIGNTVFTSSYGGSSVCLEVQKTQQAESDPAWQAKVLWTEKQQGYMSTPVVIDDHIYMHLRNQRFTCLEAATGQRKWTTTPFGKYWSLVANGTRLLALDQTGELLLINASPEEFQVVDRMSVAKDSWAHLAVAGEQVFVRDLNELKAYTWR